MSTPAGPSLNREERRRRERAERRAGASGSSAAPTSEREQKTAPLPGQFWRSWIPFLLAPLIGAIAVMLQQSGAPRGFSAAMGAVLGLLFASGALVRLWFARRLGRWTSLAALMLAAGILMGGASLIFPECPGRIGTPGRCSQYEVGTYMLLGALTILAATLVGAAVGMALRLPGRAGALVRTANELRLESRAREQGPRRERPGKSTAAAPTKSSGSGGKKRQSPTVKKRPAPKHRADTASGGSSTPTSDPAVPEERS